MVGATNKSSIKAVLLLSGGLDSILAGKLLLEQGIEVIALNFTSPFCNCSPKSRGCSAAVAAAKQLGVPVTVRACGADYLETVKHPRFGRGRGMNACLDCRIHLFKAAKELMEESNAAFVATGEVLGERPMSQRRDAMQLIERESGLSGYLLRPLSAQHFPETLAEQAGLVDRRQLLAMQGRGRKPQIALANTLGITDYPCPAGGCKLTERGFAAKFAELLNHEPDFGLHEAKLLSFGRHFRLPNGSKVILGRDEHENAVLENFAKEGDAIVAPLDAHGPTALICKTFEETACLLAAGLAAHFMKEPEGVTFILSRATLAAHSSPPVHLRASSLSAAQVESYRIGQEQESRSCGC